MTVTVSPEQFTMVIFDAATIQHVAERLVEQLGLDRDLRIDVDETTPIARVAIASLSPLVLTVESGSFEDSKRPRHLSELAVATNLARVLYRVVDRERGGFADAPPDASLTLALASAWDTYAIGRLGRLGYTVHEPRWRYNFRNRHGFTDVADHAFDQLWSSPQLIWAQVEALSAEAASASTSVS